MEMKEERGFPQQQLEEAKRRLAHVPTILSSNRRMAIWSDIKEALFLWCANPACSAMLMVLKRHLGYPATEAAMHPCTQLEQLMFLKQYITVSPDTLLVDISTLRSRRDLIQLHNLVKSCHSNTKDPCVKTCTDMMAKVDPYYYNKIAPKDLTRKKYLPSVRRTTVKSLVKEEETWSVLNKDGKMKFRRGKVRQSRSNQSLAEGLQMQGADKKLCQTGGPVIQSVIYSVQDPVAHEALVPLGLLRETFPVCQGYLEEMMQLYLVGCCGQENLHSVTKCSFDEAIQLTRFLASHKGYDRPWACLTSCSVMVSWAEFYTGYTKRRDSLKLLPMMSDISVVTLSCEDIRRAVPEFLAESSKHQQQMPTSSRSIIMPLSSNKIKQKVLTTMAEVTSKPIDSHPFSKFNVDQRIAKPTERQETASEEHLVDVEDRRCKKSWQIRKADPNDWKRNILEVNCPYITSTSDSNQKTLGLDSNKEGELSRRTETLSKEIKSKNLAKVVRSRKSKRVKESSSRTVVRMTRSSVNIYKGDQETVKDMKDNLKPKKKARKEHLSDSLKSHQVKTRKKTVKDDSNNSAVDENGHAKVSKETISKVSTSSSGTKQANDTCAAKVDSDKSEILAENKAIYKEESSENKMKALQENEVVKSQKPDESERTEDEGLESDAFSMTGIEVSITPKRKFNTEVNEPSCQRDGTTNQSLMTFSGIGKRRGRRSPIYPERTVLKISSAKIVDNIPLKILVKKPDTPKSSKSESVAANVDKPDTTVQSSLESDKSMKLKGSQDEYTPKYICVIPKYLDLKTPGESQHKPLTHTEKLPNKSIRSQNDAYQNGIGFAQPQINSQTVNNTPTTKTNNSYPVIHGTLNTQKETTPVLISVSLPGPLNPISSKPASVSASLKLPDEIVNSLKEQASKSICSILGNSDMRALEEIHAEGKIIRKAKADDVDMSDFQTERMTMWQEKVSTSGKDQHRPGRLSRSADVIHRKERRYTYRPTSSIYCHTYDSSCESQQGSSFKAASCTVYSRSHSQSPLKTDSVTDEAKRMATVAMKISKPKTANKTEVYPNYGSSSSRTPDIYDEFARRRRPKNSKSDSSTIRSKLAGQSVQRPVPASQSQASINNVQQQAEKHWQPATPNHHTAGYMSATNSITQRAKLQELSQVGEPFQQKYSHVKTVNLPNLPYTSIQSYCKPSYPPFPMKYPSCIICRQSSTEFDNAGPQADTEELTRSASSNRFIPTYCQTILKTDTQSKLQDGEIKGEVLSPSTVQPLSACSDGLVKDESKQMRLLDKVCSFAENCIAPKPSSSLESIDNLKSLLNLNFTADASARSIQRCKGCIEEACKTNYYPFRHSKECTNSLEKKLQQPYLTDTLEMQTDSGEKIARISSQLYFSIPCHNELFKVEGNVTIPANAQFYVQTNAGEYVAASSSTPSMSSVRGSGNQMFLNKLRKQHNEPPAIEASGHDFHASEFEFQQSRKQFEREFADVNVELNTRIALPENEPDYKTEIVEVGNDGAKLEQKVFDNSERACAVNSLSACEKDLEKAFDASSKFSDSTAISQPKTEVSPKDTDENGITSDSSNVTENDNSEQIPTDVEPYRHITPTRRSTKYKTPKSVRSFQEFVEGNRVAKKKSEEDLQKKSLTSAQVQYLKESPSSNGKNYLKKAGMSEQKLNSKPVLKALKDTLIAAPKQTAVARHKPKCSASGPVLPGKQQPQTTSGVKSRLRVQEQKHRPKTGPIQTSRRDVATDKDEILLKDSPIRNDIKEKTMNRHGYSRYKDWKSCTRPKTSQSGTDSKRTIPSRIAKSAKQSNGVVANSRDTRACEDTYQVVSALRRLSIDGSFGLSSRKVEARRNRLRSFVKAEFDKSVSKSPEMKDSLTKCPSDTLQNCNYPDHLLSEHSIPTKKTHSDGETFDRKENQEHGAIKGKRSSYEDFICKADGTHIKQDMVLENKNQDFECMHELQKQDERHYKNTFITQFHPTCIMNDSEATVDYSNKKIATYLEEPTMTGELIDSFACSLNSNTNNEVSVGNEVVGEEQSVPSTAKDTGSGFAGQYENTAIPVIINPCIKLENTGHFDFCEVPYNIFADTETIQYSQDSDTFQQHTESAERPVVLSKQSEGVQPSSHLSDNDENTGTIISIENTVDSGGELCLKLTGPAGSVYNIPDDDPSYLSLVKFYEDQKLANVIKGQQIQNIKQTNYPRFVEFCCADDESEEFVKVTAEEIEGPKSSTSNDLCKNSEMRLSSVSVNCEQHTDVSADCIWNSEAQNQFMILNPNLQTYSMNGETFQLVKYDSDVNSYVKNQNIFETDAYTGSILYPGNKVVAIKDTQHACENGCSHLPTVEIDVDDCVIPEYFEEEETVTTDVNGPESDQFENVDFVSDDIDNVNEKTIIAETGQNSDGMSFEYEAGMVNEIATVGDQDRTKYNHIFQPQEDNPKLLKDSETLASDNEWFCPETRRCGKNNILSDNFSSQTKGKKQAAKSIDTLKELLTETCNKITKNSPLFLEDEQYAAMENFSGSLSQPKVTDYSVSDTSLILNNQEKSFNNCGDEHNHESVMNEASKLNAVDSYSYLHSVSDSDLDYEADDDERDEDYVPEEFEENINISDEDDFGDIYDDVRKINISLGKPENSKKPKINKKNPFKQSREKEKVKGKSCKTTKYRKKPTVIHRKVQSRPVITDIFEGSQDYSPEKRSETFDYEIDSDCSSVREKCLKNLNCDHCVGESLPKIHTKQMKSEHTKHQKTKSKLKRKRKSYKHEDETDEKESQKVDDKAAEGFIKTQKIYFDIIKNSSLNKSTSESTLDDGEQRSDEVKSVPRGIPVHGDRVITKAIADAEKALEGTGSLSDDHEPDVIEDFSNSCTYQLVEDEDHINLGGVAYFRNYTLPFVYINGYKYVPLRDTLTLFQPGHCFSACTIPRSVLQKNKQVVKTFSTWDQVYKFELIKMKKGPPIKTGDIVLKLDSLLNSLPELVREVVSLHHNTKLKRSQNCDIDSYRIF